MNAALDWEIVSPTEIEIRRAQSVADYRACQDAQRRAWGITEECYVVPIATMAGAGHHGGLVLGAFLPDGTAVGLSFAFLGRTEGRLCLYSQLTGVVPEFQDMGIGRRLKTAQRRIAADEGVPCIAWAFDPLQAGNARFNLEKLGATAGQFIPDMYGPRSDALNRDTPTDRLVAVWETAPPPPREAVAVTNLPRLIDPTNSPAFVGLAGEPVALLEIPADVNTLRRDDPGLAGRWGAAVREAFQAAFGAHYRAVGFAREGGRGFYVLERVPSDAADDAPNGSATHRA